MFGAVSSLIIILYPSIIGVSVYRDFKSNMHSILYSYPYTKLEYLLAKFLSGLLIVNIIVFTVGLGIACGFNLPGVNPDLLTDFELKPYLDIYVIIILILQGFLVSFGQEQENRLISALLDPFGDMALDYYTRYWTVAEQNELYIPIKEIVVYNRLI